MEEGWAGSGKFRLIDLMMTIEAFMVESYSLAELNLVRFKGGCMREVCLGWVSRISSGAYFR